MIKEVNKDNIEILNNSFLNIDTVTNDLNTNPFGHYLVYIDNNQVIGYIYYSDIYDRAEINQFEVDSFHRNCGIGTILLEKMINLVEKDITLEVKKDNISAISLYKKYNFVEVAVRKGYYNGVDGILMERKVEK